LHRDQFAGRSRSRASLPGARVRARVARTAATFERHLSKPYLQEIFLEGVKPATGSTPSGGRWSRAVNPTNNGILFLAGSASLRRSRPTGRRIGCGSHCIRDGSQCARPFVKIFDRGTVKTQYHSPCHLVQSLVPRTEIDHRSSRYALWHG
jgi:hypothetical protein